MHVRKRNGSLEPVNLNKIVASLERYCGDLPGVDVYRIATKTVGGLIEGVSTRELDMFSVRTAKDLIIDDPVYSRVAARILANLIQKEVSGQDIQSYSQSIEAGFAQGLIAPETHALVMANKRKLNAAVKHDRDWIMEYHGLQTVYDRYLLKHRTLIASEEGGRKQRAVIETPQYFLLRVACGLADDAAEAIELYNLLSSLEYMCSTPTLFNSGTVHSQMSSCYLNDSPLDSLDDIYKRYSDVALLSKFAGGIGVSLSRLRSKGSLIRGTNGNSNGLVPWAHTLSASVGTVNQCLHPDTKVYTETGMKRMTDIEIGDLVLGISGHYRPVTEVLRYPSANERSIAIHVRHGGTPIPITDGHPIYAIADVPLETSHALIYKWLTAEKLRPTWVESGHLKVGDYVAIPIPQGIADIAAFNEDDAFFYGLMLGDGHITKNSCAECGLSYNPNSDGEHVSWLTNYLRSHGVHTWVAQQPSRPNYAQLKWSFSEATPFTYDDLYDSEGEKRIAPRFMHLPHAKAIRAIQGLIATDGCISRGAEVTFTNASSALVEGLRYQLVRLAVMTGMQSRRRTDERVIVRADGSESLIKYDNDYMDVRVPAFEQLAEALGIPSVTKAHWLTFAGMVWSRIKKIEEIETPSEVIDLRVEFDETYTVAGALVHNGGKRKGAACIYLETHHPDLMEFLELRDNTGEKEQRAYNLNLANWISDLFMQRVKDDAMWSFFDPTIAPELTDLYGAAYERRYLQLESEGKFTEQMPARKVYSRMMRTLAETGNGWMCFKDASNRRGNQVNDEAGTSIHLSNLCVAPETMILTDKGEKQIGLLRDEVVCVWNGHQFSPVVVRLTGMDKPLLHVVFDNGKTLDVTAYHKFYVCDETGTYERRTMDLKPGDRMLSVADDTTQSFVHVVELQDHYRRSDTYCFMEPMRHMAVFNSILAGNCTEILEVTSSGTRQHMARETMMAMTADDILTKNIHVVGFDGQRDAFEVISGSECAVCNLGSINIGRGYVKHGKLDKEKLRKNVAIAIKYLDRVIDRNFYPIHEAEASNVRWRPVGLGLMGLADLFFQLRVPFESETAIRLSAEIQEEIYYQALRTSCDLAKTLGPHRDFHLTRAAKGHLQFDLAGVTPSDPERWAPLRQDIVESGLRNSLVIAIAPTATISHICGVEECIEAVKSNLLKRETLSGEFIAINKYLVEDLRRIGRWNAETITQLKIDEGSIANIADLPADMYETYKTVWEMSMKSIIAHAVARGAYIDQSHSLNMFIDLNRYPEDKRIGVLSSLYMHAWESGLKTTYYFRSRAATRIEQTTTRTYAPVTPIAAETPEVCESCT